MSENFTGKQILDYLISKGIKADTRYISIKKGYQLVVRNLQGGYIYPLSPVTDSKDSLEQKLFNKSYIQIIFSKITKYPDYISSNISYIELVVFVQGRP